MNRPEVLIITGPTASGKTSLAVNVAKQFDGEIICADAYQIYAGLPIITAQPDATERTGIPHHLYGSVPLTESMDAARLADRVNISIAEIQARGRMPIVVSGGGLYLAAITHGLDDLPKGDAALRARLDLMSADELAAELLALDPGTAATGLNLKNPRHVSRALEICLLTGRPASEQKVSFARGPRPGMIGVRVEWERAALYDRINERTHHMMRAGAVEEAGGVNLETLSATAAKTLGLRECRAIYDGQLTLEAGVEAIQLATRRYAKRQESWLRGQMWIHPAAPEEIIPWLVARL